MKTNRREFVKTGTVAGLGIAGIGLTVTNTFGQKRAKSKDAIIRDPNIVRVGFIGIGGRGTGHVHDSLTVGGIEVVSVCDLSQEAIDNVQKMVIKSGGKAPKGYTGSPHAFEQMLKNEVLDGDAVVAVP